MSDDGSMTKPDVYLDGYPGADRTARAGYRPTGINNDDKNNVVHTDFGIAAAPVVPWALMIIVVVWATAQAYGWGHLRIGRSRDRGA